MRQLCVCISLFVLLLTSASAQAKTDLYIRLVGSYSYSRLERAAEGSGTSFGLLSESGYQGQLTIGKYFTDSWNMYLHGTFDGHKFRGPPSRTIQEPETSLYSGSFGTTFFMGDGAIYLQGNYRTLMVINDVSASVHELKTVALTSGQLGILLAASSRFGYEIQLDLSGGAGLSKGQHELTSKPVELKYYFIARSQIIFGSQSTTGTTSLKFSGFSSFESRYGLDLAMQVDDYKDEDFHYTMTHLYGGLFVNLIF